MFIATISNSRTFDIDKVSIKTQTTNLIILMKAIAVKPGCYPIILLLSNRY
jgi:hypothetical protein